jgi:erythronolide synthase/tylactone synthase/type I polyketide synthase PikAI/8,8a-deoxyoleandolide synthase
MVTAAGKGLGLLAAKHLVADPAIESAVLLSRSSMLSLKDLVELGSQGCATETKHTDCAAFVIAVDVNDEAAMSEVTKWMREHLSPCARYIHTAGVNTYCPIEDMAWQEYWKVCKPKVVGTALLDKHAAPAVQYDLLSSVSSVVSQSGSAHYSSANSFLDHSARYRRHQGHAATSTNWGPFSGTGMAYSYLEIFKRIGIYPCSPDKLLESFARVLGGCLPSPLQQIRMHIDRRRFVEVHTVEHTWPLMDTIMMTCKSEPAPLESTYRPLTGITTGIASSQFSPTVDARSIRACVEDVLYKVTGTRVNNENAALVAETGMDSLGAVDFRDSLQDRLQQHKLGQSLPATLVFDYPTLAALELYLADCLLPADPAAATTPDHTNGLPTHHASQVSRSCPVTVLGSSGLVPVPLSGIDGVGVVPDSRWVLDQNTQLSAGKIEPRFGAFLHNINLFDATVHAISCAEAEHMDVQQRLALQETLKMIASSGCGAELQLLLKNDVNDVAVAMGVSNVDYTAVMARYGQTSSTYTATGGALNVLPGRIAYTFNFSGAALAIDTACSSSLVAAHIANHWLTSGRLYQVTCFLVDFCSVFYFPVDHRGPVSPSCPAR